jgi:hypothetical protein
VVRYEHRHPGDLIHFDSKHLAHIVRPGHSVTGQQRCQVRGVGWEYLHIAIDVHSRIGFAALLPYQSHRSVILFFLMASAHFNRFGREPTARRSDSSFRRFWNHASRK